MKKEKRFKNRAPGTSSFRSGDDEEEPANKTETEQPEIQEENKMSVCLQSQLKEVIKVFEPIDRFNSSLDIHEVKISKFKGRDRKMEKKRVIIRNGG